MESAITLPMVVFLVLGTLQLFLMLHARIMTQYAAFRATRAGSVSQGNCERMKHAAIAALLPTVTRTDSPARLGSAFKKFKDNDYAAAGLPNFTDKMIWLIRENPTNIGGGEDVDFDQGGGPMRLEMRLVYWYPMQIPFANWVMTKMFRAEFAIEDYTASNPLLEAEKNADWVAGKNTMEGLIRGEYANRSQKEYVFPIATSYSMRMMTPAKPENFTSQRCD
ncbi:MAG: TadE/TadG family type IV pilus assembly protein [Hyalangium sp.]|uniref:TadE/TadG family type IV pilus assembly protein n=1 Tax=Hyalangium sp. TaxID=2028555 RepID=UPI00389AC600